ncbi:MAG: hypothetical protein OXF26_00890 [Alphaproteobacteria bacterium]|nr:hypothetical protein [Alphaproteobacteria bacterium]MCY4317874.1 hypothetical protein [Alphaproteobacteria bacterium]
MHRYRTPVGEIAKVRIEGVTVHSGRVGHASELIAYGASTTEVILSGGWKTAHMVVHYAAGDGRTRRGGEIFLGACQFPHLTGQHGRLAGYQTRHRVLLHFAKIRCKLNA